MSIYKYAPYAVAAIVILIIFPLLVAMLQPQPTIEGFAALRSFKHRTVRNIRQGAKGYIVWARDIVKRALRTIGV